MICNEIGYDSQIFNTRQVKWFGFITKSWLRNFNVYEFYIQKTISKTSIAKQDKLKYNIPGNRS